MRAELSVVRPPHGLRAFHCNPSRVGHWENGWHLGDRCSHPNRPNRLYDRMRGNCCEPMAWPLSTPRQNPRVPQQEVWGLPSGRIDSPDKFESFCCR